MTNDPCKPDKTHYLLKRISQLEQNMKVLVLFINDNRLYFDKKEVDKLKSKGYLNN